MKRFNQLTSLEIKRQLKTIPKLLPSTIFLLFIVIALGVTANNILTKKAQTDSRIPIGVVSYDDSKWMTLAIGMINSIEAIEENIELKYLDLDEAADMLDSNELMAVIIIPDNVFKDIISEKNTPVEVLFNENAGFEAAAFKEIADAAVSLLASAQAGVYSVYDFYDDYYMGFNMDKCIDSALDRLNESNIKSVLARNSLFNDTIVLATGDLDTKEYYLISGVVLFLLLFGINYITFSTPYKKELTAMLHNDGVSHFKQTISRFIGLFSLYLVFVILLFLTAVITGFYPIEKNLLLLLSLVIIAFVISSIVLFIRLALKNQTATIIVLFFSSILQAFVTGGLIPAPMLPDIVVKIGQFTPVYYILKQLRIVILGFGNGDSFIFSPMHFILNSCLLLAIGGCFILLSTFFLRRDRHLV